MTQNNDVDLAARIREIQKLAGDLDRAMREDTNKQLFLKIYQISDEAGLTMELLNNLLYRRNHDHTQIA